MKNDGGQAFPSLNDAAFKGMSLRDWFAGMALGDCFNALKHNAGPQGWESVFLGSSSLAYQMADAMLAEREKDSSKST